MNRDVFIAVLAMDSYNRGYNAGIDFGQGSDSVGKEIGLSFISSHSSDATDSNEVNGGFYALSYTVNGVDNIADGQTVISFRGTDSIQGDKTQGSDLVNGWSSFTGLGSSSQFALARAFNQSVTHSDFPVGTALLSDAIVTRWLCICH